MRRIVRFRAGFTTQIMVYDEHKIADTITLDFGDAAYVRGYARTNGALSFFPIIEDCLADFTVWHGSPDLDTKYARKVEGTLILTSGELCIHDPEDPPFILSLSPGSYIVSFTQTITDIEDFLEIDVFLQRKDVDVASSSKSAEMKPCSQIVTLD